MGRKRWPPASRHRLREARRLERPPVPGPPPAWRVIRPTPVCTAWVRLMNSTVVQAVTDDDADHRDEPEQTTSSTGRGQEDVAPGRAAEAERDAAHDDERLHVRLERHPKHQTAQRPAAAPARSRAAALPARLLPAIASEPYCAAAPSRSTSTWRSAIAGLVEMSRPSSPPTCRTRPGDVPVPSTDAVTLPAPLWSTRRMEAQPRPRLTTATWRKRTPPCGRARRWLPHALALGAALLKASDGCPVESRCQIARSGAPALPVRADHRTLAACHRSTRTRRRRP